MRLLSLLYLRCVLPPPQKCRLHAGFNIKLLDNLTLSPQYAYQTYHNRNYADHIIYVTFLVKL